MPLLKLKIKNGITKTTLMTLWQKGTAVTASYRDRWNLLNDSLKYTAPTSNLFDLGEIVTYVVKGKRCNKNQ